MTTYDLEEQEQLAELKAFWKQYGNMIVLAVAIAAAIFAGYRMWHWYQGSQSGQASAVYGELQKAATANDSKKVRDLSGTLIEQYPRSAYAPLGALISAKAHFAAGDLKTARAQLAWVVENARDSGVQALGRLRLANVLIDEKAHDEALKVLAVKPEPPFEPLFEDLRGDVYAAQTKRAEAKAAYQAALAKLKPGDDAARELIQLKVDGLGDKSTRAGHTRPRWWLPALLAVALAGCGSMSWNPVDWFTRSAPPAPAPLAEISSPVPARVLWQSPVGRARDAVFTPAVAGGSVFAAGADGLVTHLDAATGKQVWQVKLPSMLSGGVGSDGKLVVVGSAEGEVIALDSDGRTLWRARVSSEVLASPEIAGDLVVVRSADNRIFALDARDGRRRWLYQRAAPTLAVRSPAGLVVRGGYVFAGFSGGKLVALALANGGLRWEGTVSIPKGTTELERVTDVIGLPWVGDRETCAVAFQGRVACFDLGNGNQIWGRDMSSSSGLGVDARYVYVSEDRGAVSALERATGRSLWRQDRLTNRNLSAPLALGAEIAVGDLQGYVHLLARDSGAFVGRIATDGSPVRTAPVLLANGFLVQTSGGTLYALATR